MSESTSSEPAAGKATPRSAARKRQPVALNPRRTPKKPRPMPRWVRDRDWALLGLLALLNIGSAYTTILGARQILPAGMSDVLGLAVQLMLFLMLAGFAVNRSVIRRWMAITLFAAASIYTSFFTYYEELAKEADERVQLDRAMQEHAGLVSAVYQPARSRSDKLNSEAEAMIDLADREANRGSTTGVKGYGPVARRYAEEGNLKLVEAQRLEADVDRLQPHFEYEMEGLTAEEVYRRDLSAWQLAPQDWKVEVPAPLREDYVDLSAQVALLTPYNRVRAGEMPAIVALMLAAFVDGIAIFLGTAIQARNRPPLEAFSESVASVIGQLRRSREMVAKARSGESEEEHVDEPILDDALGIVSLRIAGRGSDFLTTFYQAIHPETGALDYAGLQRHPNATYRIAARMLVDQLRAPELGWVRVEGGWWSVPDYAYPSITAWLGEQIRRECELEAQALAETDEAQEPERTLRLVIPAA